MHFFRATLLCLQPLGRLLVPVVLLVVSLFVVLAFCSYPVADDFAFAARAADHDFLTTQVLWYREWSA